jgi:membrane-associated phospholipid phosphatase
MNFLNFIIETDRALFLWIQQHCHTQVLDTVMPWMREKSNWYPLYFILIVFLSYRYRWAGVRVLAVALLCFMVSDLLSSHVAKPVFERLRPCADPEISRQFTPLVNCANKGFSFTSSHAANHFTIAVALSIFFLPRKKWPLMVGVLWAGTISLAQVYVGVHYPLDIFAGACLGISVAILAKALTKKYASRSFILMPPANT